MTSHPVYITLPIADLPRSIAFFTALGLAFDPRFAGDGGACLVLNATTFVMLATHDKFAALTPRRPCDTATTVEALLCLTCDSRDAVDEMVARAVAAGGTADKPETFGPMYTHGFTDPDGHAWGLVHMAESPDDDA